MDFRFNLEQRSLGESVGELLARYPALSAPDHDPAVDDAVWHALAETGLFALLVPEDHGGLGLAMVDLALLVERLGAALASLLVTGTLIATDWLVRFGTAAQKDALLPAIAAGTLRVALATQEAGQSFGGGAIRTLWRGGRLDGAKITVAGAERADWFLVLAASGGGAGLVLVERTQPGVSLRRHDSLDPSAGFCELQLEDVSRDGASAPSGGTEAALAWLLDIGPTLHAGLQIGIAARMLDASVEYARTRVQFGQPIGAFQAIKHRCADLAVAIEAARSAAYYAFWAVSENAPDRSRASSMAKAYCGEVARDACNDAIQIHGGMGFTWDMGLHRFLRRAKILEQSFGNQAWHYERVLRETLAARHVSAKPGLE